jgi:hypothetical protein
MLKKSYYMNYTMLFWNHLEAKYKPTRGFLYNEDSKSIWLTGANYININISYHRVSFFLRFYYLPFELGIPKKKQCYHDYYRSSSRIIFFCIYKWLDILCVSLFLLQKFSSFLSLFICQNRKKKEESFIIIKKDTLLFPFFFT